MMDRKATQTTILGGICGIIGTLFYVLANFLPFHQNILYAIVMAWPILSIIFIYSIYSFVAVEHQTTANRLAFIFGTLGFTIVACMISVQLAVKFGIQDFITDNPQDESTLVLIRKGTRLVDFGLDVAWDLFIGTSLLFLFVAMKGHSKFRLGWALPSLILAVALIILNIYTFPKPPNTAGLFDVGPLIGAYIIALSSRLLYLGVKQRNSVLENDKG